MSHAKRLDRASGILFLLSFVLSKLRYIPFSLFSAITYSSSLVVLMMGYFLWFLACQLYPEHPRLKGNWYAFSQFKNQNRMAAVIGSIAIICCFAAFAFPVFMVPACWLFVLSNIFWGISQFHKMKNPPTYDPDYSSSRQRTYLSYVAIMISLSILNAISATLLFIFPLFTVTIIALTIGLSFLLCLAAFNKWLDFNFIKHQPDRIESHSYASMKEKLDINPSPTPSLHVPEFALSDDEADEIARATFPTPINTTSRDLLARFDEVADVGAGNSLS
ncbi:MAG: hypothetical protein Q8M03_08055 [Legionella sp.]|nr:hypothetical protein [Legionella sp.]